MFIVVQATWICLLYFTPFVNSGKGIIKLVPPSVPFRVPWFRVPQNFRGQVRHPKVASRPVLNRWDGRWAKMEIITS